MTTNLPIRPLFSGPWWVSPSGSDTVGDGTQSNPWRQVQKAIDFIRTNRINEAMTADVTVNVRQGSYTPVTLGVLDSGFNGHRMRYVSFDGPGKAIFEAGLQITNWTNVSGNLFKAPVPNTFWTLYENDVRSNLCRLPKRVPDATYPSAQTPYLLSQSDTDHLTRLIYNPLDFNPAGWSASDLRVYEYSGGDWIWFSDTNTVSSIDTTNKILNYGNEAKFNLYQHTTASRYFVQGVQAMQSDPGEWWLDRGAGQLYYIARDGDIHSQVIMIPTASECLTMTGRSWKTNDRVSNVTFDGFAGMHTDYAQWYRPGYSVPAPGTVNGPVPNPWLVSPSYAWFSIIPQNKVGAFHLRNVDNIELLNFHVSCAGMYGVLLDEYASNNTLTGFWVNKVALAGVRLDGQFPGLGDIVNNNILDDFKVNNTGELSSQGPVQLAQSGSNHLSHFELYNSPRQGIWVLGPIGAAASQVYCGNNLIEFGKIHNVCQDSNDVGALGFDSFSNLARNTAQQMLIDSVSANASVAGGAVAPVGVFCDDETGSIANGGQTLTNIWATNTQGNGFRKNNSDGHVLTNCSFLVDGSPNGSFNSSLIDVAHIGTTASFPY